MVKTWAMWATQRQKRGRVRCKIGAQGCTRAVHGPRPTGSLRLCKLAFLPVCLTGPLPTNISKRGLDFHPSPFCLYLAVREGFEPSIRVSVYTLSRRAPSATQTPHRKSFHAVALLTGANVGKSALSVNTLLQESDCLLKVRAIC